jgi:hypothetical protein
MKAHARLLFVGLGVATAVLTVQAQDDVYLVSGGQVFRWASQNGKRDLPPQRVQLPAELATVASFAVNRRSVAYATTGGDGRIFQTNGETARVVYQHAVPVSQVAFGRSNDILFFSVVVRPQPEGEIYTLNLTNRTVAKHATVTQAAIGGDWAGAFTVDLDDRVFLGTPAGRMYELRAAGPALVYERAGDAIQGLSTQIDVFYATGGAELFQLRDFRTRSVALTRPASTWSHVSYHALPLSDEIQGDPCELFIQLTGTDAALINLFAPVIRGPNLNWAPTPMEGNGGRSGTGIFRYFVQKGTYWVRLDTRADVPVAPQPREQRVQCQGTRAAASFRVMR